MQYVTEKEQRTAGIQIAQENGLPRTKKAVASKCWKTIMRTLADEVGIPQAVQILRDAKNPEWACYFAREVSCLTEAQVTALFEIVRDAKNPELACYFARNVSSLTEVQRAQLQVSA